MTKFLHTCVRVKDLEASLKFYKEALGFKEARRNDFPEYKFTLVYLQLEDDPDYELELTYNYDHEAYDLGDGYGHIAVGVDDLEATHQAHKKLAILSQTSQVFLVNQKCTTLSLIQMAIRLKLFV